MRSGFRADLKSLIYRKCEIRFFRTLILFNKFALDKIYKTVIIFVSTWHTRVLTTVFFYLGVT